MSLGKQGRGSATIFSLTGCEQALKSHGEASRTPREVRVQRVGAKFRAKRKLNALSCCDQQKTEHDTEALRNISGGERDVIRGEHWQWAHGKQ